MCIYRRRNFRKKLFFKHCHFLTFFICHFSPYFFIYFIYFFIFTINVYFFYFSPPKCKKKNIISLFFLQIFCNSFFVLFLSCSFLILNTLSLPLFHYSSAPPSPFLPCVIHRNLLTRAPFDLAWKARANLARTDAVSAANEGTFVHLFLS